MGFFNEGIKAPAVENEKSEQTNVYQRVIEKAKELVDFALKEKQLTPEQAQEALKALERVNNKEGEKIWRQDFKEVPEIDNPEKQETLWAKYLLINLGFDIEIADFGAEKEGGEYDLENDKEEATFDKAA